MPALIKQVGLSSYLLVVSGSSIEGKPKRARGGAGEKFSRIENIDGSVPSLKPSVATGSLDYFANKNSIWLEMSRYSNTSLLDRWFQEPR